MMESRSMVGYLTLLAQRDPRPLGEAASHNCIVPTGYPMTMISRRSVLLGAVGSTIPQIGFVDARKPGSGTATATITSTGSTSGMVFSPVSIGGGGYITGIQMMSDGT